MVEAIETSVSRPVAASVDEPFYYLQNFETVVQWVLDRYADILDTCEITRLREFFRLPQKSRALYVRMVMRKGDVFRVSKLSYTEIGKPFTALKSLTAKGWVICDPSLSLAQLFELLTKDEVASIFTQLPRNGRKSDWFDTIADDYSESLPFSVWCSTIGDSAIAIADSALWTRVRLLFFGNLYQSWSEFVLADLGIYRYETVTLTNEARAFQCLQDIEHYEVLHQCRESLDSDEDNTEQIIETVTALATHNAWIQRRRSKLFFKLGQRCEKHHDWQSAYAIYQQCDYPGARVRSIRVLEHLNNFAHALHLCEEAINEPGNEAEHQQALRMLPRLRRRLGIASAKQSPARAHAEVELTLPVPTNHRSVEMAVQALLECEDGPVFYVENTLINSLFGLLFWDAIFAPVPGAFFHPFQADPADLLHPEFRAVRASYFDERFQELATHTYRATILKNYRAKQWIQSPFVHWAIVSEQLLNLALDCIAPEHLCLLFTRLLQDIKTNRSGLPDLIQFWPAERRYQMIEVKGPGDRLQDNQKRWLNYCVIHKIPVAVCYVQWQK